MAELPFPSSGGLLEAFLQRMRLSPNACVDITWLVECLGISQRPNAGQTLRWLQVAGILDKKDGVDAHSLTKPGRALLLPTSAGYREAARSALESLLDGSDALDALSRGEMSRQTLRSELCAKHGVGESTANKAIIGMYAVAELAGEEKIASILGRSGFKVHRPKYPRIDLDSAKRQLLDRFALFTGGTGGIDGWLNPQTPDVTIERLMRVRSEPLTAPQFNQLLTLSHAPPLSPSFFHYYWLSKPQHTYDLEVVPGFSSDWEESLGIFHLEQLYWGLYRFYTDALLYFGNVRRGYQVLREMDADALLAFFAQYRVETDSLIARGPSLALLEISRDDRYLIAEQACKSYAPADEGDVDIEAALRSAFRDHRSEARPIRPLGSF